MFFGTVTALLILCQKGKDRSYQGDGGQDLFIYNVDQTESEEIRMRSDTVKKGVQQRPHRSLFNALGMTEEELDRPLIE